VIVEGDQPVQEGWILVPLRDIAEVRLGRQRSPDKATGDFMRPYLRAANVTWAGLDLSDVKEMNFDPAELEVYALHKYDIVLSEASGSASEVGKPAIWNNEIKDCCLQNTLIRVRAQPGLAPFLLHHFVYDARSGRFATASRGIGIHHLGAAALSDWSIALPPEREQRRIVAKLEALTETSRRAKEALDAIPPLLERFRQSVLAAAFRGDLTAEWRAKNPDVEPADKLLQRIRTERRRRWEETELAKMQAKGKPPSDDRWKQKYEEPEPVNSEGLPELPPGWTWASVELLTSFITDGEHATPARTESGVLLLSARNVGDGCLRLANVDYISESLYGELSKRVAVEAGDVLLSCSGSVGRSCVVPEGMRFALVRSVAIMRPLFGCGDYVSLALRSPFVQGQIDASKTQTAQANIFQGRIKKLVLAVAPEAERNEIVKLAHVALSRAMRIQGDLIGLDQLLKQQDRSILAKAFRGDLVPQDPSDEPASVLLDRIRAERAAAASSKEKKLAKRR
jgi:type I restriction enzyme S subunit